MSARRGDEDDDALWSAVKKSVTPLPGRRHEARAAKPARPEKQPARAAKAKSALAPVSSAKIAAPRAPALPPLAKLDRRAKTRIARGGTEIEGRLDLHGYKLAEAKHRLADFLQRAQSRGKSLVLVITGKGTAAAAGAERGVLKREVPMWLSQPEFRALVIGFEPAASAHGGAGALYVRVRRKR